MIKHDVLCTECARPVHDSLSLCELCCKAFTDDLLSIPGLFADLIVTEARLDRISSGRNGGGKSAETAIPIRITGKIKDEPWRDTNRYPYEHSGRDDRIQTRHPHDQLVTTLIKWGNMFARRYPHQYRVGAPGLINSALMLRAGNDERELQPPMTRLEFNDDTQQLEPVVKRPASRGDTRIAIAPVTDAEQIAVWLAHNPQYIRTFEAAHTMIADITKAIIKVRLVIDRRPDLRYIGPCPSCGNELRAETGEQWVRCRRCNEQHEITKVIRAAMKRIEDNLYPMPQISQYLELLDRPVPLVTLHSWHYRGRLRKRGWLHTDPRTGQKAITKYWLHRNDPPVFRLGDVLRIVERQTTRTTGT